MIKNIRIINENPYNDMRRRALKTKGLKPKTTDEFNEEWVKKSIISRHSHIRSVFLEIEWETSKAVRDQLLRSKSGYVEPYVTSQRPDNNDGKPRDPNALSTWIHDFNVEALVKMMSDRLCTSTERQTRLEAENLKSTMMMHEDAMIRVIGDMLSPKCCWLGNCNEFQPRDCFNMCANAWPISKRILDYTVDNYGG